MEMRISTVGPTATDRAGREHSIIQHDMQVLICAYCTFTHMFALAVSACVAPAVVASLEHVVQCNAPGISRNTLCLGYLTRPTNTHDQGDQAFTAGEPNDRGILSKKSCSFV